MKVPWLSATWVWGIPDTDMVSSNMKVFVLKTLQRILFCKIADFTFNLAPTFWSLQQHVPGSPEAPRFKTLWRAMALFWACPLNFNCCPYSLRATQPFIDLHEIFSVCLFARLMKLTDFLFILNTAFKIEALTVVALIA